MRRSKYKESVMTYDKNNVFARIIRGEIPAKKVFEDERLLAIQDAAPAAPVHVLVMPKGEYQSFADFSTHAPIDLVAHFFHTAGKIAMSLGVEENGYRIIANHGPHASQTVPHFHLHILGGKKLGGLLADDALER